jgi:pimeloyl-ACP methyl ester carboxylesterase
MAAERSVTTPPLAPLWGELRYSAELARLLAGHGLPSRRRRAHRRRDAAPVLLIPGFMAGDNSLSVLRRWLRGQGHPVRMSGIRVNVGCAERITARLQRQLRAFADEHDRPVVLVGQSRGGALARSLAVREPEHVSGLVMLGTPVCDGLAISPSVMRTVRWVASLGDLGIPRLLSTDCATGDCCADFRQHMQAPLDPRIHAVSVHSRSDGIVDWRACLDPHAQAVEVDSSHCGMSVHRDVYRLLEHVLERCASPPRAGAAPSAAAA